MTAVCLHFSDGPFMLLIFAGITALIIAFVELFCYALLRSKRTTCCLPSGGPTSSRGGKTCAIVKEELLNVISRGTETKRRIETSHASPRINRFGTGSGSSSHRPQNGDIIKTNGGLKNGHSYYQTQALLRKDAHNEEDNVQL